jgi:hypothetical protein
MSNDAPAVELRRPTSLEEMAERMTRGRSAESLRRARAFKPRPDDVIIATYPKSGTTWMQQIVHGLRTGGSMDFDEITEAVPWIERAYDMGLDIAGEQAAPPRAFKSHLSGDEVQEGCRYIVVIRDPRDVAVSSYHFLEGWFFEPGSIPLDAFLRARFLDGGSPSGRYWPHLVSWWRRRNEPEVLLFCYEDMKADLPGAVRRVAAFLGMADREADIEIATRQAGIDFMKAHGRQFDDHLLRELRDPICGLPPGGTSSKVREGRAGSHKQVLSPELLALLDEVWQREVTPVLGFKDYPALRAALTAETGWPA